MYNFKIYRVAQNAILNDGPGKDERRGAGLISVPGQNVIFFGWLLVLFLLEKYY